ncbi:hypothetical protein CYMTET_17368 [Cymbomonas tetramitiformis]|uniref:Uncharacterized protein n=1 Tax=Cymbomonas tetramitiformis TaxID=36881 RepID=A0AAE0L7C6_9CHLO|nr:hypothetical protein CYMTET_17368 [Cymbomonas tetramitiformis]|eukprot:gene3142-3975_t
MPIGNEGIEEVEAPLLEYVLWDPKTFQQRRTTVVPVPKYITPPQTDSNYTAEVAARQLALPAFIKRYQETGNGVQGVVIIIGSGDSIVDYLLEADGQRPLPDGVDHIEAIQRLKLMCGRGICKAALDTHSVIITAGYDRGAVGYQGRANKDRHHRIPVVGVVGRGLVTWPGDDRVDEAGTSARVPLQADHTHYVMCNTENDEPSVTRFRFDFIRAVVKGAANESTEGAAALFTSGSETNVTHVEPVFSPALPVVVYVVNGEEQELWEVQQCVRAGYPICVVRGTGGIADDLADANCDKLIDDHVPEAKVMEIIKDGTLEFVDIKQVDGVVMRDMTKRLFAMTEGGDGDETLKLTWELAEVYKANQKVLARQALRLSDAILLLTVLTQVIVALKPYLPLDSTLANDAINYAIIILPISISILIGLSNRFRFGLRAKVLASANTALVQEIYRYRAGMADYITAPGAKLAGMLSDKVKTIRMNVMGTAVSEGTIKWAAAGEIRKKNYVVSSNNDGMSKLSPEDYLQQRMVPLLDHYEHGAVTTYKSLYRYTTLYICLGGIAVIVSLFGAIGYGLLVVVPVTFASACVTIIEQRGFAIKILSYNKAAVDIKNNMGWWRALTAIEQSNPLKFADLVKNTELAVSGELSATNPGNDMTSSGGGGGGGGGLDLKSFMADVKDNVAKDGKMTFKKSWMGGHPDFFVAYQDWLENKMEMKIRDEGPAVDAGGEPEVTYEKVEELGTEDPLFALEQLEHVLAAKDYQAILEENDAEEEDIDLDTDKSPPVERILWDELDFFERRSDVAEVGRGQSEWEDVEESVIKLNIPDWMKRMQGWEKGPKGLIIIVGGTDQVNAFLDEDPLQDPLPEGLSAEQATKRLNLLTARGIVRAAIETHSVVLTSGADLGVVGFMGRGNKDRYHKCPLVGVVGKGVTTWPGDVRPDEGKRTPLQADHTHFVMLNAALDQAGVTRFRVETALAMQRAINTFSGDEGLPTMVLVMNGTYATLMEVLQYVRHGLPVAVIKGSGGAADAIANAAKEVKDDPWIKDPRIMEIVMEGTLDFLALGEADGANMNSMISRMFLGGDTGDARHLTQKTAWERVWKYRGHAAHCAKWQSFYTKFNLFVTCLAVICACINTAHEGELGGINLLLTGLVILFPIMLSVASTVSLSFQFGLRASVLAGAVEQILLEIYQFRTGMGDYASQPDAKRTCLLCNQFTDIGNTVAASIGEISGMDTKIVEQERAKEFRVSADDDGFSTLAPAEYLNFRVVVEMHKYQNKSNTTELELRKYQTACYFLGGVGTALATLDYFLYVPISVAITTALLTYIETMRFADKLSFYNYAAGASESCQQWWKSLSSISVANPLNFAIMVKTLEDVKKKEVSLINPAAGGGGGGGGAEEVPGINFLILESDIGENIQDNGIVKFKQTWVEKHMGFFGQYEKYLKTQGFFTARAAKIQKMVKEEAAAAAPLALEG